MHKGSVFDELVIWVGNANTVGVPFERASEWFTPQELHAWQSLKFEELHRFYVTVHLAVRTNVAALLDIAPSTVKIVKQTCPRCGSALHGPPALIVDDETMSFSLSKSNPFFAFSLARFNLGIDIERRDRGDTIYPESDVFSVSEQQGIAEQGGDLALRYWIRKEATMKARGIGIVDPLNSIDVSASLENAGSEKGIRIACDDGVWYIQDVETDTDDLLLSVTVPDRRRDTPVTLRKH